LNTFAEGHLPEVFKVIKMITHLVVWRLSVDAFPQDEWLVWVSVFQVSPVKEKSTS